MVECLLCRNRKNQISMWSQLSFAETAYSPKTVCLAWANSSRKTGSLQSACMVFIVPTSSPASPSPVPIKDSSQLQPPTSPPGKPSIPLGERLVLVICANKPRSSVEVRLWSLISLCLLLPEALGAAGEKLVSQRKTYNLLRRLSGETFPSVKSYPHVWDPWRWTWRVGWICVSFSNVHIQ